MTNRMTDVLKGFQTRQTPQSQPAGKATTKNAAGGHVFAIDDMARVRRFLVLGTSGGTYYTRPQELTKANAEAVVRLAQSDPVALVDTITEISVAGRAPRQNPCIFALALAASLADEAGRAYALAALPKVCRIGTHIYLWSSYIEGFRGWGPALVRAVASWYNTKDTDRLAYQILKYRQREGWRHADLLALSHPKPIEAIRDNLYRYIVDTMTGRDPERVERMAPHRERYQVFPAGEVPALPDLVGAYEAVQQSSPVGAVNLIAKHDLSWEMLPDRLLSEPMVWEALIAKGMPQTALMRQLPRLTRLGLTDSRTGTVIAGQLDNAELLKRGRVHPINILVAQRTYASGRSVAGEATWTPTPRITDALDSAFYKAYGAIEPAGKPILLACDVSGSMGSPASGLPISCREVCAALSLVTLNVEKGAEVIGFSDGRSHAGYGGYFGANSMATRLDISPRRRLDDVTRYMAGMNFGRTDCALPMIWALKNKLDFEAIQIYTDNETWFGQVHPWQALDTYRQKVGHDVKLTVVSMTATGTSIANPDDPSQLDIAGFDSNVPQVLSEFAAGLI
jgi:60 kDa SS-A/Ro ribonucleoprotein